jgi:hypothetical protein
MIRSCAEAGLREQAFEERDGFVTDSRAARVAGDACLMQGSGQRQSSPQALNSCPRNRTPDIFQGGFCVCCHLAL